MPMATAENTRAKINALRRTIKKAFPEMIPTRNDKMNPAAADILTDFTLITSFLPLFKIKAKSPLGQVFIFF